MQDCTVPPYVTTEVDINDLPTDVEICGTESLIDVEGVSFLSGNLLH